MLTQQYLLSFAQNFWPRKREKGGGRKERKDKILHLVVLSSQVVPVGFCFICTGWEKRKRKQGGTRTRPRKCLSLTANFLLFRGAGERQQKKGAEDQLKPTSALRSWSGFFFLFLFGVFCFAQVSHNNFACTGASVCCLLEGGHMKSFLGTHLLFIWRGFIIYSRGIL